MATDRPLARQTDLYNLLTGKNGVIIYGGDVMAANYGDRFYQNERLIRISGGIKSYECFAPKKGFPKNISFTLEDPHLGATNASHIENCHYINTDLDFEGLVSLLESEGMRFEGRH